ncbi:MAG: NAD(P)H-dependent oxidoreductase subunit E [Lachnospiraceae bacterium]|nr:NAD(P)H-dependent oxidoreductase subunit E [Lachnospiraceae bacterium]
MEWIKHMTSYESILESWKDIVSDGDFAGVGLMRLLDAVEKRYRYIPGEAIRFLAERLQLPEAQIRSVIRYSDRLHEAPQPKYTIRICKGAVCGAMGPGLLLECCLKELGIQAAPGQESFLTEDGTVRVELTGCIGACSRAPAMTLNDEIIAQVAPEKIAELIQDLKTFPKEQ